MPRVLSASLLPVLLSVAVGCGGGEPLVVIAGPDDVTRIELRTASGETLWLLESDRPRELAWLVLGEVPDGFRQVHPAAGERPRDLEPWEPLELRVVSEKFEFRHYGEAIGTSVFEIENWQLQRRVESEDRPPDGEEASADEDRR